MDPLGLALENFNAMGLWRDKERGQPLDAGGRLITGESFEGVRELKRVLKERHRDDFYRCLTEKLLTYALGPRAGAVRRRGGGPDRQRLGPKRGAVLRPVAGGDRIGAFPEAAERFRRRSGARRRRLET